ncbi:Adenylosuccinate lyase [Hondaea fermentalgiana]|uniref:Adenylosuccinate lyase n=1 Tax=Hondaea fermentalgiana TaxID=2315210 RepID=A0A2R5GCF1_9STRA|nr:Adenylosuccinate lyase [Hondaea fermentalgiana]|eukprot:GBG28029.1 Adenylosuccinate lyase [Hondaea fermentalgiana]
MSHARMDDVYENPLTKRYASAAMSYVWSADKKFSTWRRIWLALAESEQELGLDISDEQLEEMRNNLTNINYEYAEEMEKQLRHDVMSHIHAWGEQCPKARPVIHLGATSCFVVDNTEQIQMHESLVLVHQKVLVLMSRLAEFAMEHRSRPTLGFTHYQPAQLVTVGKRASLWLQDFMMDFQHIENEMDIPLRGVKGTTGTQASFLELFDGDHDKVLNLNELVLKRLGFSQAVAVSGQTYTRKLDFFILAVLSGIAQSAHKMCTDIRLLANLKEIEEPFGKKQVGSSAMAYKRNPMRSERVCSLARYVMCLLQNTAMTHSTQWMERTLDDSANRRLVLPEAFLATDALLTICIDVISGLHVWPKVIEARVNRELPFMATENILMEAVKHGGDRQTLHEVIREHSMAAAREVKGKGNENDLMDRIRDDESFSAIHDKLNELLDPINFVGRAPEQVREFIEADIQPLLDSNVDIISSYDNGQLKV